MDVPWTLQEMRREASKLLTAGEFETLSIMLWDETWQARPGWNFRPSTVGRYRGGLLLVRPCAEINMSDFVKHELGHHVCMDESGRHARVWRNACAKVEGENLRPLAEGAADAVSISWGGTGNPFYEKYPNEVFQEFYWQGRQLLA